MTWTLEMYWLIEIFLKKKSSWGRKNLIESWRKNYELYISSILELWDLLWSQRSLIRNRQGGGGTCLQSQHSGGRHRLDLSSKPAWTTECVPGQSWLCREILSWKTKKKKKEKRKRKRNKKKRKEKRTSKNTNCPGHNI